MVVALPSCKCRVFSPVPRLPAVGGVFLLFLIVKGGIDKFDMCAVRAVIYFD